MHGSERVRVLVLLRVREQLLQVVEVRPRAAERGDEVVEQDPVAAPDEPRDGRQRRAPRVLELVRVMRRRPLRRALARRLGEVTREEQQSGEDGGDRDRLLQSKVPRKISAATVK